MQIVDDTVYSIIHDTWASTLGFEIEHFAGDDLAGADALIVSVKLTGAWDGEVRLRCSRELGQSIAASIFKVDVGMAGDHEIVDALSELIHIIGGNLKPLLPQPVNLSLPSFVDPADWGNTAPQRSTVCSLTLVCQGIPFVVALLGSPSASASSEPSVRRPMSV